MRRREVAIALLVAVAAGLVMMLAIGAVVSLGTGTGRRVRGEARAEHAANDAPPAPRQIPVLCYHYVSDSGGPVHFARVFGYVVLSLPLLDDSQLWRVSAREFERQMEYLVARGYHAVTLDELHEWQLGWRELPPMSVAITFDDGDVSAYDEAYPVLRRLGLRATLFVVTSRVGTRWGDVQCMGWDRLREMQRSGLFDVESHTDDLHYKVSQDGDARPVFVAASERGYLIGDGRGWRATVFDDLLRSRSVIQRRIGRTPHYLAWPYGFGNPALDALAADAGFTRTFALRAGAAPRLADGDNLRTGDTGRFEIPRYAVTARTSLRDFRAMLDGTYRPSR